MHTHRHSTQDLTQDMQYALRVLHFSAFHCEYSLEIITKEITATTTYEPVARNVSDIVTEHLKVM